MPAESRHPRNPRQNPAATADTLLNVRKINTAHMNQPKYKAAAITFIVINSISVIQGLIILFMYLQIPSADLGKADGDAASQIMMIKASVALYSVAYLATSAYALVIGCLVLTRRSAGLWMSGPIVSIVAGLLGMIMLLLHLPVSIWLIIAIKRLRQHEATEASKVERI